MNHINGIYSIHRDIKRNLRKAGTAGQNNIQGMYKYRQIAVLASTGFTLSYLRPTWRLTAEIKDNMTTTDYLDDFGRGTYYGGDFNSWRESVRLNIPLPIQSLGRNETLVTITCPEQAVKEAPELRIICLMVFGRFNSR